VQNAGPKANIRELGGGGGNLGKKKRSLRFDKIMNSIQNFYYLIE
jgi:hypothetical protein